MTSRRSLGRSSSSRPTPLTSVESGYSNPLTELKELYGVETAVEGVDFTVVQIAAELGVGTRKARTIMEKEVKAGRWSVVEVRIMRKNGAPGIVAPHYRRAKKAQEIGK